jgi:hypothetical protein
VWCAFFDAKIRMNYLTKCFSRFRYKSQALRRVSCRSSPSLPLILDLSLYFVEMSDNPMDGMFTVFVFVCH